MIVSRALWQRSIGEAYVKYRCPYLRVFNIAVTTRFVMVTIAAHAIFGVGLGLTVRWLAKHSFALPISPSFGAGLPQ